MLPAAIRYSKARRRPLISPGFWVSTAMLLLGVLVVWEAWQNPDWMTSLLQNLDSSDVELELSEDDEIDISPPSGLSAAERAIAEVDELEKLIKKLDVNITATPNKPQSKGRASSRQKPAGASSLTLDPQFQDQLVSTDVARSADGTLRSCRLGLSYINFSPRSLTNPCPIGAAGDLIEVTLFLLIAYARPIKTLTLAIAPSGGRPDHCHHRGR